MNHLEILSFTEHKKESQMKKMIISRFVKWLIPLPVIAILVALTACASPTSTNTPVSPRAPVISFVKADITEAGDSASGANVNFSVMITEMADTIPVKVIYYYNATPPTTPGVPAYSEQGTYLVQEPADESFTWKDVPPGRHVFSAQLVNWDNDAPLDPPAITRCLVTVPSIELKTPELRIASAELSLFPFEAYGTAMPEPLPPLQVQISSAVNNFNLNDDKIGKQNSPGEGHLIYYLDTEPLIVPGQLAATDMGAVKVTTSDFYLWENVPAGQHVFSIQLVNNDNTPLDPAVVAQIVIVLPENM
jgi:hypothetical protein